jgi:hypothetical protein
MLSSWDQSWAICSRHLKLRAVRNFYTLSSDVNSLTGSLRRKTPNARRRLGAETAVMDRKTSPDEDNGRLVQSALCGTSKVALTFYATRGFWSLRCCRACDVVGRYGDIKMQGKNIRLRDTAKQAKRGTAAPNRAIVVWDQPVTWL